MTNSIPEQGTNPEVETPVEQTTEQPEGSNTPEQHMIPKSRFDEINNEKKELQTQLQQLLEEQKQRQEQEQLQKGEFESLYTETKSKFEQTQQEFSSVKTRTEQLEGVINALYETKIAEVPEDFRDLIPENLSIEKKLEWVNNAQAKGLFGFQQNKATQPLGQPTNTPTEVQVDVSKMSIGELFKSAYSRK